MPFGPPHPWFRPFGQQAPAYGEQDALLAELAGLEPIEEPQAPEMGDFQTSPFEQLLEGAAPALAGLDFGPPRSFGEGLLGGLARGLSGRGAKIAASRQRFDKQQASRQQAYDMERRKSNEERRQERIEALRDVSKRQYDEGQKRTVYERDHPLPTPEQLRDAPWLANATDSEGRVTREQLSTAFAPSKREPRLTAAEIEEEAYRRARGGARADKEFPKPASEIMKPPAAAERQSITDAVDAINMTDAIAQSFDRSFVGPFTGRRRGVSAATGVGSDPKFAAFSSSLAEYVNKARNVLFGGALSEHEIKAANKQFPQATDTPDDFKAKLEQTRRRLREKAESYRRTLGETGVDVSGLSPLPEMPGQGPAGTAASRVVPRRRPLSAFGSP